MRAICAYTLSFLLFSSSVWAQKLDFQERFSGLDIVSGLSWQEDLDALLLVDDLPTSNPFNSDIQVLYIHSRNNIEINISSVATGQILASSFDNAFAYSRTKLLIHSDKQFKLNVLDNGHNVHSIDIVVGQSQKKCSINCASGDYACLLASQVPCMQNPLSEFNLKQKHTDKNPHAYVASYFQNHSQLKVQAHCQNNQTFVSNITTANILALDEHSAFALEQSHNKQTNQTLLNKGKQVQSPLMIINQNLGSQMDLKKITILQNPCFDQQQDAYEKNNANIGVSATLEYQNDFYSPIVDAEIWLNTGRKIAGVWMYNPFNYVSTSTDDNGYFEISRSVSNADAKRKLKLKIKFKNDTLRVGKKRLRSAEKEIIPGQSTFLLDLPQGDGLILDSAKIKNLKHINTHTEDKDLLSKTARVYVLAQKMVDMFVAENMGFAFHPDNTPNRFKLFQEPVFIDYPSVRTNRASYANIFSHIAHIKDLSTDFYETENSDYYVTQLDRTVLHELIHIWEYQRYSKDKTDLFWGLINGLGTHNCQENETVALSEGLAQAMEQPLYCKIFEHNKTVLDAALIDCDWNLLDIRKINSTCNDNDRVVIDTEQELVKSDLGVEQAISMWLADPKKITGLTMYSESLDNTGFEFTGNYIAENLRQCSNYLNPRLYWNDILSIIANGHTNIHASFLDLQNALLQNNNHLSQSWVEHRQSFWFYDPAMVRTSLLDICEKELGIFPARHNVSVNVTGFEHLPTQSIDRNFAAFYGESASEREFHNILRLHMLCDESTINANSPIDVPCIDNKSMDIFITHNGSYTFPYLLQVDQFHTLVTDHKLFNDYCTITHSDKYNVNAFGFVAMSKGGSVFNINCKSEDIANSVALKANVDPNMSQSMHIKLCYTDHHQNKCIEKTLTPIENNSNNQTQTLAYLEPRSSYRIEILNPPIDQTCDITPHIGNISRLPNETVQVKCFNH